MLAQKRTLGSVPGRALGLAIVAVLLSIVSGAAIVAGACGEGNGPSKSTRVLQPTDAQLAAAGLDKLPVAPESERVDLIAPPFSHPTNITNPLFPISNLQSAVLNGTVEGKVFHTETTLLPYTRVIEWTPGQQVETLVSQYVAFIDGRIEEVALDYYAQADDGSVWYFGEDLFDYNEDGLVDSTEGTWLAGREGPAEMIMPGDPKVGQVFRSENIPAVAFEEVTIKTVGETLDGPAGPVEGAITGRELHMDGTYSDKQFAPGYGEFFSQHGSELEALALAVPTDALDGPPPGALEALSSGADDAFDAVQAEDWAAASADVEVVTAAWQDYRGASQVPPRLEPPIRDAIDALSEAVSARDQELAGTAAIDVAQAMLDIKLRYRSPAEIDLARFELWARQLIVDAAAGSVGGVSSDLVTMEWVRDRFANSLNGVVLTRIDAHLLALRDNLGAEDLTAASAEAASLRGTVAGSATRTPFRLHQLQHLTKRNPSSQLHVGALR